jgi:hypothetical protein
MRKCWVLHMILLEKFRWEDFNNTLKKPSNEFIIEPKVTLPNKTLNQLWFLLVAFQGVNIIILSKSFTYWVYKKWSYSIYLVTHYFFFFFLLFLFSTMPSYLSFFLNHQILNPILYPLYLYKILALTFTINIIEYFKMRGIFTVAAIFFFCFFLPKIDFFFF